MLYGTAWSADTLLATQKRLNLELEARDGIRRHFEAPWERVAEHNPSYGAFVQAEIARLGLEHPLIRTQYCLLDLEGQGRLFSPQQLALLQGDHPRQHLPTPGRRYLAGVASFLLTALGPRVVEPFLFTAPSKSQLAYTMLEAVNAGRLTLYQPDGSVEAGECWSQLRLARTEVGAHQRLGFYVPERDGHDDFLISLALAAHAATLSEQRRATGRTPTPNTALSESLHRGP